MNPELRRNLWLEATPVRLSAVTVGFAVVMVAIWLSVSPKGAGRIAFWVSFVTLVVLGGYHAVSTIADEFQGRTWDWQRLSGQRAWSLLWGKIIGGGVLYWYIGLLGFAVYFAERIRIQPTYYMEKLVLTGALLMAMGLFSQGLALALALSLGSRARLTPQGVIRASRVLSLAAISLPTWVGVGYFNYWDFAHDTGVKLFWYGYEFGLVRFVTLSCWVFAAWVVFAAWRQLRAEMQFHQMPWGWTAFVLFLIVYNLGFTAPAELAVNGFPLALYMLTLFGLTITYVALIFDTSTWIDLQQLFGRLDTPRWRHWLRSAPGWLPIFILVLIALVSMRAVTVPEMFNQGLMDWLPSRNKEHLTGGWFFVAVMLFFIRDVGLVLFIRLNPKLHRPYLAPLGCLVLLYWPANWLMIKSGAERFQGLFMAYDTGHWMLTALPPLLQCLVVAGLLMWRLKRWRLGAEVSPPDHMRPRTL